MIKGKLLECSDDLSEVIHIRTEVFLKELSKEEYLSKTPDQETIYAIVYEHNIPVATGSLIYQKEDYSLSNIAVLKESRGKNYGDLIIRMLLNKAFSSGINQVTAIVPIHLSDFFFKEGFLIMEGTSAEAINKCNKMVICAKPLSKCDKKQEI